MTLLQQWLRALANVGAFVLLLVAVSLAAPQTAVAAEGVTITLPPDLAEEQRDAFLFALERLQVPVTVEEGGDEPVSGDQPELALLIDRFDAAVAAAPEVPGLVGAWFGNLEHTSLVGCLLALIMIGVALALGGGAEVLSRRLLDPWRRRCLALPDERFTTRLLAALGWFAIDLGGLAIFFAGAMLAGWLLAPGTETTRFTLAILIVAVVKIRFFIGLACLVFSPSHPELRLLPMTGEDVRPVYR